MKHFSINNEQELETCINGSIYCLMNIKALRDKANSNGLKEMLEQKLEATRNEQMLT